LLLRLRGIAYWEYRLFMSVAFRTLLIWLLVAAMPVKVMAGVGTGACGPGHPSAASSMAVHAWKVHEHSAHSFHAASVLAQLAAHQPDGAGLPGPETTDAKDGTAAKLKCSSCAPCCAAAAPPPVAGPLVVLAGPNEAHGDRSAAGRDGVFPDVPHKPPRVSRA
jgi:hypothetical protein